MAELNRRGSPLGGATRQYFLRFCSCDGWIRSGDVCAALVREGVLDTPAANSKRDLARVQDAFNSWHDESGLPRTAISGFLALNVGRPAILVSPQAH